MAKFTAGKWVVGETGYIYADKLLVAEARGLEDVRKGDRKLLIARTEGMTYLRNVLGYSLKEELAEMDANARLIAAAPRMYELLKQCVQEDIDPDLEGNILWLFRDIEDPDVQGNELVGG